MNGHATEFEFPKLFITDLDGTTLGGARPYKRFPDAVSAFLDRLDGMGCRWATNTTWDAAAQLPLFDASSVRSRPAYVIGGAGLQLATMNEGGLAPVNPYSAEMDRRKEDAVRSFLSPFMKDLCARFEARSFRFNGYWFSMTCADDDADRLFGYVEERYMQREELTIKLFPEERRLYAHPDFLKKGTAVRELLRVAGLRPQEVVVAGDEIMDLDMMLPSMAAHAVCPANAHPDVKERVRGMGGAVGTAAYGGGVVDAFGRLAESRGWKEYAATKA